MAETYEIIDYNRYRAVSYANRWAYFRNPEFYDFSEIGGDCTNFASQVLYAGTGVMNYLRTYGWYYINANDRAPAWTSVKYLYDFITKNKGEGPFGEEVNISNVQEGDIVQLSTGFSEDFHHTPVITAIDGIPSPTTVFVAAHSNDCNCRPLNSYDIKKVRFVHILGARKRI